MALIPGASSHIGCLAQVPDAWLEIGRGRENGMGVRPRRYRGWTIAGAMVLLVSSLAHRMLHAIAELNEFLPLGRQAH
ncbi:MAG: hypothetical protein O9254_01490 [Rhodobacteraceae bacterium]|nr:hypothetical protein [Paracoccaceae bacterium]